MPIEDWISALIALRHERVVPVEPERAIELALRRHAESDQIVSTLVRLRGMKAIVGIGAPPRIQSRERFDDAAQWRGWDRHTPPCRNSG